MNFLTRVELMLAMRSGQPLPLSIMQSLQSTKGGHFGTVLNGVQTLTGTPMMPIAPTPPSNSSDPVAQQKYEQALQTYNTQFQMYNTQMMNMFFQRFQMMQQSIYQTQRTQSMNSSQSSASSGSSSSSGSTSDIGSILY